MLSLLFKNTGSLQLPWETCHNSPNHFSAVTVCRLNFEPEIKYTLSKSFPVPQNKILRRSQYNGYDLINSLKQWDYKKSSTEILAWIDEMLRAEKALKQDNLSEHERKVWRAVKADAINTLTNSCL